MLSAAPKKRTKPQPWLVVSKNGLRKQVENRDRSFILYELIQNAIDEAGCSRIRVSLCPVPHRSLAWLHVIDDAPAGFRDLTHAYTLFEDSYKKSNPEQRGRYNLGEKMILALAEEAKIESTTGGIVFDKHGRRRTYAKRDKGTQIQLLLRLTRQQVHEMEDGLRMIIPPKGVEIICDINGSTDVLPAPPMLKQFGATLPTILADEDGCLTRPTIRKTTVEVYDPLVDKGWLYEMGIPVVETGDRWSVNICQKIPLNMDRDNVRPAFLAKVRAAVLNEMATQITKTEASESWVKTATAHKDIRLNAYREIMDKRFGEKRVMFDPNDKEAGMTAVCKGHTLVHGNQLSKGERDNMRRFRSDGIDLFRPAGRAFPSAKPYGDDPDAPPTKVIPETDWTDRQKQVVAYSKHVFKLLKGGRLQVKIVSTRNNFAACYGSYQLDLNQTRLGKAWFNDTSTDGLARVNDLLLHEFSHHGGAHHLEHRFHEACTSLGATLINAALSGDLDPARFGWTG